MASGFGDDEPRLEILELLLQNGGDVNVKSSEEHDLVTPRNIASIFDCLKILKVLVAQGGDHWIEDSEGHNALYLAHQLKQQNTFEFVVLMEKVISHGINPGPIDATNKQFYLKQFLQLHKE